MAAMRVRDQACDFVRFVRDYGFGKEMDEGKVSQCKLGRDALLG